MTDLPKKAYCVRRRVHAIDEMLVYADSVEHAKERAKAGEWVYTERLERLEILDTRAELIEVASKRPSTQPTGKKRGEQ